MKVQTEKLTPSERNLLERFKKYDKDCLNPAVKAVVEEYAERVFIQDIFAIVVEDVFKALSLTDWNEKSRSKIIASSREMCETSGCFYPADNWFLPALTQVWIANYLRYKGEIDLRIVQPIPRSIFKNAVSLQFSMCPQFFNSFPGPLKGKQIVLEQYMFFVYGRGYRDIKNHDNHLLNFKTLLHFISFTGFSYHALEDSNTHS
jgi:hypothetical protein